MVADFWSPQQRVFLSGRRKSSPSSACRMLIAAGGVPRLLLDLSPTPKLCKCGLGETFEPSTLSAPSLLPWCVWSEETWRKTSIRLPPPPVPFLRGCVAEEKGAGDFSLFPRPGSPPSRCLLCAPVIIPGRGLWGRLRWGRSVFCPGLHGWIVETAPGCRLLSDWWDEIRDRRFWKVIYSSHSS